jgi:hypothetical protein
MKIQRSNWAVWSYSSNCRVELAVRPSHQNYYSCSLTTSESSVLSDAILECAARVERKCGGCYYGLWRRTYKSALGLVLGGAVAVESHTTSIGLTIFRTRSYSVAVDPAQALELACRLWIQSQWIAA